MTTYVGLGPLDTHQESLNHSRRVIHGKRLPGLQGSHLLTIERTVGNEAIENHVPLRESLGLLGNTPGSLHAGQKHEIAKMEVLPIVLVPIFSSGRGVDTTHDVSRRWIRDRVKVRGMTSTGVGSATHARDGALLVKASNPESVGLVNRHADLEVEVGSGG